MAHQSTHRVPDSHGEGVLGLKHDLCLHIRFEFRDARKPVELAAGELSLRVEPEL